MATAPQHDQEQPEPITTEEKSLQPPKQSRRLTNGSESDAQEMVISSLRSQIQDLFSQVTQLNSKLVKSYDRVSDLEDDLHVASSNVRASSLKISQLELERTQHLSALNTGLLVEKAHVTAELNRLMEKATEEAAQRGQAETARADIEKDLDDLSATLFGQANTMVAEARYARALSERKVEEAELALRSAEEAVGGMQQQMQALQAEKENSETKVFEMQTVMGKGKWLARAISRVLALHCSFAICAFGAPQPPAMTTLLPLPFLARLVNEDSEPTIRLDLAPSLNWLSRRSVLSAIHNGQLTIEPMSSTSLLNDPAYSTIPGLNSSNTNISCALCGAPIFNTSEPGNSRSSIHSLNHTPTNSWSKAIFKKPLAYSPTSASSNNMFTSARTGPLPSTQIYPQQVHIFRLASAPAPAISSVPIPTLSISTSSFAISAQPPQHPQHQHHQLASQPAQPATVYPLCSDGWCLMRLRATCTLWAFVRTGIVDKVWEEHIPKPPPPPTAPALQSSGEKPPVPPRRRGLWGMASALGERAASWSDGDKEKKKAQTQTQTQTQKNLPPPPVLPATVVSNPAPNPAPPPLPRRSETRARPSKQPENAEPQATTAQPTQMNDPAPPVMAPAPKTSLEVSADASTNPSDLAPPVTIPTPTPRASLEANANTSTNLSTSPPTSTPLPLRPNTPSSVPLPDSVRAHPQFRHALLPRFRHPAPLPSLHTPFQHLGLRYQELPHPRSPDAQQRAGPVSSLGVRAIEALNATGGPAMAAPAAVAPTARPATPVAMGSALSRPATPLAVPAAAAPVATPVAVAPAAAKGEAATVLEATSKDAGADEKMAHAAEEPPTEPIADSTVPVVPGSPPVADAVKGARADDPDTAAQVNGTSDAGEKEASDKPSPEAPNAGASGGNGVRASEDAATEAGTEDGDRAADADTNGHVHEYVGDAAWEERTWKEVVRLKEEMFWARVGASVEVVGWVSRMAPRVGVDV
ncbi:hypothetical protein BD779DRAFT_1672710 [Infundibulicybe gibba]|nr:hypothetical protein BD779DRAFT_1672710 [Infundibulicybe gibba]